MSTSSYQSWYTPDGRLVEQPIVVPPSANTQTSIGMLHPVTRDDIVNAIAALTVVAEDEREPDQERYQRSLEAFVRVRRVWDGAPERWPA